MVVIGAGSGGLVTTYIAAVVEAKVILIEKHKIGGDCLNTGCVPSKALISTSHNIKEILQDHDLRFVKVLTARGSDKISGAILVGSHARDLLAEFTLAMRYNLGLNKILATIHPYPSMSEASRFTAGYGIPQHFLNGLRINLVGRVTKDLL